MNKYLLLLFMGSFLYVNAEEITIPEITVETYIQDEQPILTMQETTPGMKQPVIHGLMGDKILITLDNNKFSNSLFRSGPNQYYSWVPDQFVIHNTVNETLLNSSLGGTVNRTLGINTTGIDIEASSNTFTGTATYSDKSFQAGFTVIDNANVVTPSDGEVKHSSYNQKAAFLSYKSENSTTKFMLTQSDDIDRTDKFEKGDYYVYELQRYSMLSHEYKILGTDIIIMPSLQQFREKIDRDSSTRKNIDSTNNIFALNISNKRVGLFTQTDTLKYGLTNHYEDISYTKGLTTTDYYYNTFSLWTSYKDNISEKWDYGLTYNFSALNTSGGSIDRSMTGSAFGINLNYYINDTFYTYGSFNSNFKFPTITNLAEARSDSVEEIANPNLDSEKALTTRVGIYYEGLNISLFQKKLYDMIIRVQTNIPDGKGDYKWMYENTDKGYINGLSFIYAKTFGEDWKVRFNAEFLDGKTDYDYISKLQSFVSSSYVQYKDFWVEFLYAPSVAEDKMALKDKTDIRIKNHNDGYNILNMGYSYAYKNHTLSLYLDNILNSSGRVYGSSVDFNERRVRVKYTYYLK